MGKYRKGYNAIGDALRRRAEADQIAWEEPTMPTDQSDPVAVLRAELGFAGDVPFPGPEKVGAALAELERRQGREKRLEALVRGLLGAFTHPSHVPLGLDGLVGAARKEIENG